MRGNVRECDGYKAPELIFETREDAADVLVDMKKTLHTYGCVTVADMLDMVDGDTICMDEDYGWTSLITACVARIRNGYIIDLPRPILLNCYPTNNKTKKEKETMKYNTLADICSKNPDARMTIGYHSFPVKIRNISCDSSNPYDSTTILTVENSGDPYAPLFKKYGDTNAKCIKRVIFNDPATIVFWSDGTKTVVKCDERDEFDPEKGLAVAIAKKSLGNNYNYYDVFEKFLPRTCLEEENVVGDKKDVPKHCRTCWYGEPKFMTSGICDDCRRQWFLKGSPAHWRPLE